MKSVNRKLNAEEIRAALVELNSRAEDGEQWKHFAYGYFISNKGRVWNECGKNEVHPYTSNKGYKLFDIFIENKREGRILVHRAVYSLFGNTDSVVYPYQIISESSKWEVHHLNMQKGSNSIDNLYLILDKHHGMLHTDLQFGRLKLEDVDTREKLDQWLMLHTDALQWFTDEKNK